MNFSRNGPFVLAARPAAARLPRASAVAHGRAGDAGSVSWKRKSFDELPALSVRGSELRRYLRTITLAWVFGSVWMVSVAGSRMTNYARMLGFENRHFGILAALPFVANLAQLAATVVIERTGLRKFQFLQCAILHRLLWLGIAAIPLVLPLPSAPAVWTMLGLFAVSSFLASFGAPAWWSWMGDLIPRRIRGRYLATRALVSTAVRLPVVIGLALLLDAVTRAGEPRAITAAGEPLLLWVTMGVFAVAGVFGTVDILLFRRLREVVRSTYDRFREPQVRIVVARPAGRGLLGAAGYALRYGGAAARELLLQPLSDRVFRRYVAFGMAVAFAMAVGAQFYWLNSLENLGFSQFATDVLFLVFAPLAAMGSLRPLGRLVDRWGRRPVLMLGMFLACFSVLPYFFASRHLPPATGVIDTVNAACGWLGGLLGRGGWRPLGPAAPVSAWLIMALSPTFGGIGWTAVALGQQGIILGFSDGKGGSKYVAAFTALSSVGGVVGGLCGGEVAEALGHLQDHPLRLGPFLWNNWHATFVLSLAARIVSLLLLVGMPDPGSRRVRDMMRLMRANVYNNVMPRLAGLLRPFQGRYRRRGGPPSPGNAR